MGNIQHSLLGALGVLGQDTVNSSQIRHQHFTAYEIYHPRKVWLAVLNA